MKQLFVSLIFSFKRIKPGYLFAFDLMAAVFQKKHIIIIVKKAQGS